MLFNLSAVQSILYSRSLVDKKIPLNLYLISSKLKSMLIVTSGAKDDDRIRSVYAGLGWVVLMEEVIPMNLTGL